MASDVRTDEATAHALFQSLDAMEGLSHPGPAAIAPAQPGRLAVLRAVWPGFLVAATIALASTWLSQHYGAPVMLFALLFGMAFHFLHEEGRCVAGIEFSSKALLRLGVALLGVKITLSQIASLGVMPIATVVVGVVSTIAFGVLAARALGLKRDFGILSGGAVGDLRRLGGARHRLGAAQVSRKRARHHPDRGAR